MTWCSSRYDAEGWRKPTSNVMPPALGREPLRRIIHTHTAPIWQMNTPCHLIRTLVYGKASNGEISSKFIW